MALTYTTYIAQISNIMAVQSSTTQFQTMAPGMIDYAEQRLYRELNLIFTRATVTGTLSANTRSFALPNATGSIPFITVSNVNAIISGNRNPLTHMPSNVVDYLAPSDTATAGNYPTMYYMKDQSNLIVGPSSTTTTTLEILGTYRPAPLSVSNTTTQLTNFFPDLFIAASMIFASGYQRDFGAQSDNPQQAQSWEAQYDLLIKSAQTEEARKRFNEEAYKQ
jgi:hypothetical protein